MELGLWLLTDSCTCDFLNKHHAKQPCLKYLWLLLSFSVMQLDTIICPLPMITIICNNILLLQYVSILNENKLITFDVFDSPRSLQLRYFSPVGFCHDMIHVTTLIYICYTFPIFFTFKLPMKPANIINILSHPIPCPLYTILNLGTGNFFYLLQTIQCKCY